jgi:hypothetical protein
MDIVKYLRNQWDRVGAWVLIAGGAIALLIGWLGVSDTAYPAEQIPYVVSGGLVGVFLLGLGGLLWLSADLRDEWRKLDAIERHMLEGLAAPGRDATNGKREVAPRDVADLEAIDLEEPKPSRRRRTAKR